MRQNCYWPKHDENPRDEITVLAGILVRLAVQYPPHSGVDGDSLETMFARKIDSWYKEVCKEV